MKKFYVLCLAGAFALSACGGINSGVDGGKKMSELSADEAKTLCQAEGEYTEKQISEDDAKKFACVFAGKLAEGFGGMCQESYDECMMTATTEEEEGDSCDMAMAAMGCDITVDEYEACREESIQATADLIKDISCDSTEADLDTTSGEACTAIKDKCPAFGI
jgi:hypothetical protein